MSDRRPESICAACGLPGHRYGRNEGMERFDPMACINSLRAELDDPVAVVRRGVESGTIEGTVVSRGHWAGDGIAVTVAGYGRSFLVIPVSDGGSET